MHLVPFAPRVLSRLSPPHFEELLCALFVWLQLPRHSGLAPSYLLASRQLRKWMWTVQLPQLPKGTSQLLHLLLSQLIPARWRAQIARLVHFQLLPSPRFVPLLPMYHSDPPFFSLTSSHLPSPPQLLPSPC